MWSWFHKNIVHSIVLLVINNIKYIVVAVLWLNPIYINKKKIVDRNKRKLTHFSPPGILLMFFIWKTRIITKKLVLQVYIYYSNCTRDLIPPSNVLCGKSFTKIQRQKDWIEDCIKYKYIDKYLIISSVHSINLSLLQFSIR